MKAPACDPGDFYVALVAVSTSLIPEIAKSASTPKRFQHVSPFAFFEVGFIGWMVRVSFAFNLTTPIFRVEQREPLSKALILIRVRL
jgi:hypothetical protein